MAKWRDAEALILRYIREQGLGDGARLPPDYKFAEMAGCSVQPVMRAMENLEGRGFIRRGSGSPTTVVAKTPLLDNHEMSFTHAAWTHGHDLTTRLLEVGRRLPLLDYEALEVKAQKALGLRRKEPLYVVVRLRLMDGVPRVIHRVYLNPAHFPVSFLAEHDFARESLIDVYNAHGYRIEGRQTTLRARLPTADEVAVLKCAGEPVLEAEQETEVVRVATGEMATLEYLQACYLKWEYRVTNRRPPTEEKP